MRRFVRKYKKTNKYSNESKTFDGITFRSILEMNMYKKMKEYGFSPKYEFHKYCLMDGFYPTKSFFEPNKNKHLAVSKMKSGKNNKVLDITYTPDFVFYHDNYLVIIETKGFQTAEYKVKRKLFRKYMEQMGQVVYFEIHTLKQLDEAINIIINHKF